MINKVIAAREFFEIDKFPGNFFEKIISNKDYVERYKLLLFKDDLDKLSGFISYIDDYAYIGINYKRPIGHQNFTLAHEIGHRFLKHTRPHFASDHEIYANLEESDASKFALELLYPEKCFLEDFLYASKNNFFTSEKAFELVKYIDQLCHRYFLSFTVIYNRFYYKYYKQSHCFFNRKQYINCRDKFLHSLNESLGEKYEKKYSNLDRNFYIADNSSYTNPYYPIEQLKSKIDQAIENGDLGLHTGKSILINYENSGETNNV